MDLLTSMLPEGCRFEDHVLVAFTFCNERRIKDPAAWLKELCNYRGLQAPQYIETYDKSARNTLL